MGGSFVVSAVQGEFGVMRRVPAQPQVAEAARQSATRLRRRTPAELQNLNLRLSDSYLDMDLLDERARIVLGYLRADEVVIRQR
ncbi:MAG: septum formation initiator family protein [Cypionkella sp.]|nr:septum formation initiator family protein [Cypionkella sp.]